MQKLSGLVLDIYDDQSSAVLREIFPNEADLPDIIKTAHVITADEYQKLPDDSFALVLVDGDVELKKFATIDAGNTALSVEYFLKTAHRLPIEAQRVAANNLVAACGWYDIDPPEQLCKVAFGAGAVMAAMMVPAAAKSAMNNVKATKGVNGQVMTPDEIKVRSAQLGGL